MIDKKWKWMAKDRDGDVYVFSNRPIISDARPVWRCEVGDYVRCDGLFSDQCDWKDSLREIIHHEDGKIEFRKARPELKVDDPVLVRDSVEDEWHPRHFSKWGEDGRIIVWYGGTTSFTVKDRWATSEEAVWNLYKLP